MANSEAQKLCKEIGDREKKEVTCDSNGVLRLEKRIFMPKVDELRR